jgi:hypothetical protein
LFGEVTRLALIAGAEYFISLVGPHHLGSEILSTAVLEEAEITLLGLLTLGKSDSSGYQY